LAIEVARGIPRVAVPWIVRLRYAMVLGQILTAVLTDWLLRIDLPLRWMLIPPLLIVVSNFWLAWREACVPARIIESALIYWLFVLDTVCLTAMLILSGGPTNPFSLLYLVHITLAATILTRRQTWTLGILASVCFALLFWRYRPIPQLGMTHHGEAHNLHLIGMWVGFTVASGLVTVFSGKISELLRQHEESLLRMQDELARRDRLASLVTLAAGAAHELSTPLATIAVVSKELERYATRTALDHAIAEDSRLIRTEVERCREILLRMSTDGAEPVGEAAEAVTIEELFNSVRNKFASNDRLRIHADQDLRSAVLTVPKRAVRQAMIALISNAYDASSREKVVELSAAKNGDSICIQVRDEGSGMTLETLRRVGEPFFTTKEPGQGMGLGVFLVRNLAERLGGDLKIESSLGNGTTATLQLPLLPTKDHVKC